MFRNVSALMTVSSDGACEDAVAVAACRAIGNAVAVTMIREATRARKVRRGFMDRIMGP